MMMRPDYGQRIESRPNKGLQRYRNVLKAIQSDMEVDDDSATSAILDELLAKFAATQ